LRVSLTSLTTTKTANPSISKLTRTAMTAVLSLSISARPSPHLHTGSRTWNGLPSGTTFGQLALMPAPAVSRMPSVTVWQLYRSQVVWYETRSKVTVLPVDDGGHADHGHDQDQQHPDPA
jgi:hypothetical protein